MEILPCLCFAIQALCPCLTDPQVSVTHSFFAALRRKETTVSLTAMLTENAGKGGELRREKEGHGELWMGSKPHSSDIRALQAISAQVANLTDLPLFKLLPLI